MKQFVPIRALFVCSLISSRCDAVPNWMGNQRAAPRNDKACVGCRIFSGLSVNSIHLFAHFLNVRAHRVCFDFFSFVWLLSFDSFG
eukprot:m.33601 g.33601  ORF g.33601 m.33601 type:complete len:86 (-) comp9644_c0_seq1:469-726(-)